METTVCRPLGMCGADIFFGQSPFGERATRNITSKGKILHHMPLSFKMLPPTQIFAILKEFSKKSKIVPTLHVPDSRSTARL